VGTQISVQVSYTDGHGTAETVTSAQTAPVGNVNDAPVGVPTISGTVTEDQTLTANTGGITDADGLGAFSYQWLRNGVAIGGATIGTYTLGGADVGTQISVQVSYTDGHGTAETVTSAQTAPVANVNDAPTGAVAIAGSATEDQTLTADTSTIGDADGLGAFSHQWLRDGVAIGGATAGTYTLGDADVGALIEVVVSYTDGQGTLESLTSAAAGPVANVNDAPSLDGNTLTIGQGNRVILSLSNLSASDVDNPAGSLTFTVSSVSGGRFELTSAPGVSIGSFTQADVAAGLVVFVHDGSRAAPAYAVAVSDGMLVDGPVSAGITFTAGPLIVPPAPLPPVPPPPPGEPEAAPEPERDARPTALPAPVRPALYSPGRVDPPDAQLNEFELQAQDFRRLIRPVSTLNHFTAGPYIDPTLQLLASAPANLEYLSTVPVDWTTRSAFPDAEEAPRDRIDVLLEQVQLGGMALSVGVVWWASRISGLLGSLLASAPAWRHIDPLPVVGRDEDEDKKWYDSDDRDADANELAIADVLDAQAAGQQPQQQQHA
jgi:Cadherin-like